MKTKNKAYMVDGDFVYHPDGTMVDWCEYKNCSNTTVMGQHRCQKHLGVQEIKQVSDGLFILWQCRQGHKHYTKQEAKECA